MFSGASQGHADTALARRAQVRIARGGLVLRSCPHPPLVSVAVKTYRRYQRGEASRGNGGQGWEFFGAYGFRVDALNDGGQFHVIMLHVPFGP